MKRKVLYVITKSNWGGAQKYVYTLATALPKDEFDVAVALGGTGKADSAPGRLADLLESAHVPTHLVRSFSRDLSLATDVRALFELVSLLRRERPQVVHLNSSKAGGIGALAAWLAGVERIVFTSHGLPWDEDRGALARAGIKLFSWLTFLLCQTVIVLSQDNYTRAARLPFCKQRIVLVHNGVPEAAMQSREEARLSLARQLGYVQPSEGFCAGTIAELTRNKGLSYLIEAAALLRRQNFPVDIFILGGGEEEARLRAHIEELHIGSSVHLLGFVPDAARYLPAFDCFVLPSVKEGLPYVLLEAGQAGLPVVASDIPGARDIIESEVTGLLVPPKDPKALAAGVERLMEHPEERAQLAGALKEKVFREFSIEKMVEETKKLY